MNITMVAPFGLKPKGTTRWRVLPLARALAARGHAVCVLVPSWDCPEGAGRVWQEGGAVVVSVPFPARLGRAAWPVLFARLLREARRGPQDVLHAFKPIGFSGAVAEAVLRFRRGASPRVWADADDLEAEWAQCRPPWQRATVAHQERWVLSRADGVTAASRALVELVDRWRGATPLYLPNTSAMQPAAAGEIPGRVVWYTRFLDFPPDTVADIWAAVVGATVGAGLRPAPTLHVVGAGLHGEEQSFAEAVRARGLGGTVVLHGWLEGDALAAELSVACAAMFPFGDTPVNRYKCPARLADLAAMGVPVVAHGVGECPAYVADGETGLLLPPGDADAFAGALLRLLKDGGLRARMRSAGRARLAARFAPDVLAAQLERAYAELACCH